MVSISNKLLFSALILVANQFILRGLGLVSTFILARLLTPSDFGIIALVSISLLFFDLISDAGSQQYLIQKDVITDCDLNTAWTIDITMKLTLCCLLFICAPLIASYFEEDKLTFAIQAMAIILPISALKNPKLAQLARDYNYKRLVYLQITQKIFSFAVVMSVILVEPTYWAIIAGDITAAFIFAFGSYLIVRYTPKYSFNNFANQWNFSQWLLLRRAVGFSRGQLDVAFVSKLFGASGLGGYHMTRELALIPAHNLLIPALEPLMAAVAQCKNDADMLAYRIRFSLYCLFLAVIPISVFIWLFSYEIIIVILGDQWSTYSVLLKYFSLMFLTFPLFALLSDCLIATGKVRELFLFDLISTTMLFFILYLIKGFPLDTFALARCCTSVVMTAMLINTVNKLTNFGWKRLCQLLMPITVASLIAAVISTYLVTIIDTNIYTNLIMAVLFFYLQVISVSILITYISSIDMEENRHVHRLFKQGLALCSSERGL